MKKTSFEDLIADTEALESRLADTRTFNSTRVPFYHEVARNIARTVISATRPDGTHPDVWRSKVERAVDRVVTDLMLTGGITISISEAPATDGRLDPKESRPVQQMVSHADVVEWIKAGQAGLPGGKRITRQDEADIRRNGINAKASVVMRAYYSSRPVAAYSRLRRALQTYLYGERDISRSAVLDAVVAAWKEYFAVRYHKDLEEHAADECRRF